MANPIQKAARLNAPAVPAPSGVKADDADFGWDDSRGWTLITGDRGDSPQSFSALVYEGFRKNPVVSRCVRETVTSLSEAPIRAFKPMPDGTEELIPNSEVEELMAFPNPGQSGVQFIEKAGQHYLIGGNTYWRKKRLGNGRVDSLTVIRPDRVLSAITDEDDIPLAWRIAKSSTSGGITGGAGGFGPEELVDANDIVHLPDLDPLNEIFGMPRLLAAILDLTTDNTASAYVSEVLHNHGLPGLIVGVDKSSTDAQLERAEEKFTDRYGPNAGRGRVAFVRTGMVIKEIGFNLQELEFPALRTITREGICTVYGIDPRLLGLGSATKGGSTLSGNQEREARQNFWVQTLIPLIRRWEATLNAFLAPEFGDIRMRFVLDEIAALQPDKDSDTKRAQTMAQTGVYTDREIRTETGHDPEPEEGNVIRGLNIVAIPAAEAADGTGEGADDGGAGSSSRQDGDGDGDGEGEEGSAAAPAIETLSDAPKTQFLGSEHWTPEQRLGAWKAFDGFAQSQEPRYDRQAKEQLDREREELVQLAREILREAENRGAGGELETKGITPESLAEWKRVMADRFTTYHDEWAERFTVAIRENVELVGTQVAADLGISFDVFNPMVGDFIDQMANNLSGNVADATFKAITTTFDEGMRLGEGVELLTQRIDDVFGKGLVRRGVQILSSEQRARLIARTMSTTVTNGGAVWTVRAARFDVWKEWLNQGDDRVRDEHTDSLGVGSEKIKRDETFSNGLDYPSEPNCRCTLLFTPVRKKKTASRELVTKMLEATIAFDLGELSAAA